MFDGHYLIVCCAKQRFLLSLDWHIPLYYSGPVIVSDLIEFFFHFARKIVSVTLIVWWGYCADSISNFNLLFQKKKKIQSQQKIIEFINCNHIDTNKKIRGEMVSRNAFNKLT